MIRVVALSLLLLAPVSAEAAIRPLPKPLRAKLEAHFWQPGCPVPLAQLRLLEVAYWGFDGKVRKGGLVVNQDVAAPLAKVFRQLLKVRFPIHHLDVDIYGPARNLPKGGDVSGSFECRKAVPSPCGTGSGNWSNHAYGHAVDLNPVENPYVGCGMTRDPASAPFLDRSRLRKGMVTPAVLRAFRSIGWGWGGEWTGQTKDYMHFSVNGH